MYNVELKRVFYMFLSLVVGILSAGFVSGLLEKVYLEKILQEGGVPSSHMFFGTTLFLEPIAYVLIFGAGIAFGIWLGFWGWRVVYIEHRHRMYQKK